MSCFKRVVFLVVKIFFPKFRSVLGLQIPSNIFCPILREDSVDEVLNLPLRHVPTPPIEGLPLLKKMGSISTTHLHHKTIHL